MDVKPDSRCRVRKRSGNTLMNLDSLRSKSSISVPSGMSNAVRYESSTYDSDGAPQ